MSNSFSLNPTSTDKSIKKGSFYMGVGDVSKGPTDQTNFWASAPIGTYSYLIALDRGGGIPTFYPCSNDEEFILRTNQIDTSVARTTKEQCFSYFVGQSDKMVINQDYQNVVTDGLVLNLDAGFLPSYPATGDSWYDLSVGGNTGTLANTPTFNSNGWFEFDGSSDYVDFGNVLNFSTESYSISLWTYINSSSTNFQTLFAKKGVAASNAGYAIYYNGSTKKLMWSNANGTTSEEYYTSNTIPVDTWINVVKIRNIGASTKGTFYINGQEYSITNNPTGLNVTNNFSSTLHKSSNSSTYYFSGKTARIEIYNRALSASEITGNYLSGQFDLFRRQSKNDGGINLAGTYNCLQNRFINLNSAISSTSSVMLVPLFGKSENLYYSLFPNSIGTFSVNLASAGTSKTRVNNIGFIELVGSGIVRLDWLGQSCPGILIESSSTNQFRNNSMLGASTGTPGNLPTNWSVNISSGLSRTIVDTGTENGISYIDIRVNGTSNASQFQIFTDGIAQVAAAPAQIWTNSAYVKLIQAPNPPNSYSLGVHYFNSSVFVGQNTLTFTPTSTITRISHTVTVPASTTHILQSWSFLVTNGSSYDFTIRIGYPQLELGSVATSIIPTTNAAVSRTSDTYQSPLLNFNTSSWTIFFEIEYLTNFIQQSADVSGNPLIWYFRRLSASAVNFWNQNAQQNLGSFNFSPNNSQKTFKAILSFDGTNINTYVNGTKIGNSITPTNSAPFQTLLSANTNRLRFSKLDLGSGIDGPNIIKSSCIYTKSLSDAEAISLTRL